MKIKCDDFNLSATLESGQVFGFEKNNEGRYEGRIGAESVHLWKTNGTLHFLTCPLGTPSGGEGLANRVRRYFDLDQDLGKVYSALESEPLLATAYRPLKGLRLIRQDPWEALACFILSSNNNIKRIMGIYQNLVRHFGGFPSASQLARTHERMLRQLGLGYRAPFLLRTAQFLSTNPQYLETVRSADYEEAHARVLAFPGIGPKVADCVLLYGFHRLDAFPVDVWILRAMRKLYFRNRRVNEARVHAFGQKRWGPLAGYVQQYLFHGARSRIYEF